VEGGFFFSRRASFALALGLFAITMLSSGRERPWSDATPIWQVAESIVNRGELSISTSWPPHQPRGRGGRIYATAPIIQSLMQVPGAALHRLCIKLVPTSRDMSWPLVAHLGPAALGALTCLLFFGIVRRLGVGRGAALASVGMLALGSTLWVYARYPYSEVLQAACFTGFFGRLLEAAKDPHRKNALLLGMWAGLLVNSKLVYVACLPGALVYLAWRLRGDWRALVRALAWAAAAMAPLFALILFYNFWRWGSPFVTGYESKESAPSERLLIGLWGQLFSPGKSVFLYSPPLLLTLFALPLTLRRAPQLLWLGLATVVPVVLVNASLQFWAGDWAWGPRYLVFAGPVLLLPAALLLDHLVALKNRWLLAGVGLVLALGFCVQGLGNAFFWDYYIRLHREARNHWLGVPNSRGTFFPDYGNGCGACFEDLHGMQWLPPFSPLEGHWWLIKHVPFGHDWVEAEADAPWHRYTSLRLDVARHYQVVPMDWWFVNFTGINRPIGVALLVVMLLGVAGAALLLVAELKRGPPSP
jgi:hypothetical protein